MADPKKTLEDFINSEETMLSEFEKENYILEPLVKEIDLIEDEPIRLFVRSLLLRAGVFWDMPSSFAMRFSPPDEHTQGGNILHTKRVVRLVSLMCDSQGFSPYDRDILIAAAILHDLTKGVQEKDDEDFRYDIMYPYTIDKFIGFVRLDDQVNGSQDQSTTLYIPEDAALKIARLIHCHMGPWSPIPETYPVTSMEMTLHLADHIATKLAWVLDGEEVKMERWLLT